MPNVGHDLDASLKSGTPSRAKQVHINPDHFLQTPEVAARNSNFISYANGNLASQKFIDRDILDDHTVYPDDAMMSRLYTVHAHDAATTRLLNRLWTRVKTGR